MHDRIKCKAKWFLYIDCIDVIRQPDDRHRSDKNTPVKNSNMWLNLFIKVHCLVYHIQGVSEGIVNILGGDSMDYSQ